MTAPLPMGAQKITGMADPTVATDGATKNYVDTTTATFFSTGDVKLTFKTAADTGWLIFDDGTFGSASSGSSNRANADTQPLFNLLYNLNDAWAPILTSGGGATTRAAQGTASAAWAANCRMTLPKTLGRAIGIAGAGAGLSSRPLGANTGSETNSLVTANLPPYTPTGAINGGSQFLPTTPVSVSVSPATGSAWQSSAYGSSAFNAQPTFAGTAQGGTSTAFSIMNPVTYLNAMVKL